jgi:branched-chain amino acid transport system permease protein
MGGVYGLMAMGLGIIFGVMKIVNVAHGEFVMLGAYASFWLFFFSSGFINPFLSLPISILLGFLIGLVIYKFTSTHVRYRYLRSKQCTVFLGI